MLRRCTERHRNIVGDLITSDRDHRSVPYRAASENSNVGRSTTNIDQTHAEFAFIVRQHRVARRKLLENDVLYLEVTTLDTLLDVLRSVDRAGHEVHLRF